MSSEKNSTCLDKFPRVRKRKSLSKKPTNGAHNAGQPRASLLNNNKNLALTLQKTQCELLNYKESFQEFCEFMTNVKLAKSKISAALEEFVKVFDVALCLLEFSDSKWPDMASAQACKNIKKQIFPIFDAVKEVSVDETDVYDEKDNPTCSLNPSCEGTVDLFQKDVLQNEEKTEHGCFTQNNIDLGSGGNNIGSKIPKNPSSATLLSQTVKASKIPNYQFASVNEKKPKNLRDSKARTKNKVCKRKSSEKKSNVSSLNLCRRKTFVIKSSNVPSDIEATDNANQLQDELVVNENKVHISEDVLSLKNKRKTFVIERHTKAELCQNNEYQNSSPKKECTNVISELVSVVTENMEVSSESSSFIKNKFIVAEKTEPSSLNTRVSFPKENEKSLTAHNKAKEIASTEEKENERTNEQDGDNKTKDNDKAEEIASTERKENERTNEQDGDNKTKDNDKAEEIASTERKENERTNEQDSDNKTKEMFENSQDQTEGEMNKAMICSDVSQNGKCDMEFINIIDMFTEPNSLNTQKSFSESSDLECEIVQIDEISFSKEKRAFETTPIRKHISNTKKKKFVFNTKRKRSASKKRSLSKVKHSENDDCSEKNAKISQSDTNNAISNHVNVNNINNQHAVHFISDELVNKDNFDNVCSARNKTSKTSTKKNKDKQFNKSHIARKRTNKSKGISPTTDLVPVLQKTRKKKKSEAINFDIDAISEYVEDDAFSAAKNMKLNGSEKKMDLNLPYKKTGENTYLVQAEIHPPPPFLHSENLNKENDKLNLHNMQVTVVLDDVFKSKNIDLLNLCGKDLACSQSVSVKTPLSDNSNNIPINPEENLCSDAVLDTEKQKERRKRAVCYKEPSVNRKMRRH